MTSNRRIVKLIGLLTHPDRDRRDQGRALLEALGMDYLAGQDLDGANLDTADLRGLDLSDASLIGANLRKTLLSGAKFDRANLKGADLWGAQAQEASFKDATLQDANLITANFELADMVGAFILGAKIFNTVMPDGQAIYSPFGEALTLDEFIAYVEANEIMPEEMRPDLDFENFRSTSKYWEGSPYAQFLRENHWKMIGPDRRRSEHSGRYKKKGVDFGSYPFSTTG
jgi:hypothetical protein